jgi:hypothetical protein
LHNRNDERVAGEKLMLLAEQRGGLNQREHHGKHLNAQLRDASDRLTKNTELADFRVMLA